MQKREENQGVSVGVGAVVFRGDKVLLIKRGKPPFEGHWSIPGGGLEYGEKIKDAVLREVREETSVEIDIIALLNVFDALPARPKPMRRDEGPPARPKPLRRDEGPPARPKPLQSDEGPPARPKLLRRDEGPGRENGGGFPVHTVIIDYVAEWVSGEPQAGDDAVEAEFVCVRTALDRLSWDVTRQAIERAAEIRRAFHRRS